MPRIPKRKALFIVFFVLTLEFLNSPIIHIVALVKHTKKPPLSRPNNASPKREYNALLKVTGVKENEMDMGT